MDTDTSICIYIYGMYLVCFFECVFSGLYLHFFVTLRTVYCAPDFFFFGGGGQFLLSCLAVVERGPPSKEIAGLIKGL